MAVVFHFSFRSVVVNLVLYDLTFIVQQIVINIGIHEGIEITFLHAVLVGQISEELAVTIAHA